ncbi:MAG: hypothetical protein KJO69_10700 [Gammaproteobacteria bacterium]|nr:hypothetical protein [Gammaproteobacteria bacterium]
MCGGGGYTEKEPESKLALAQQAAVSLQRYGETFVPLENAFIQDNLNAFGESAYKGSMGRASNQIAQMYENQMPDYQKEIFTAGIDPTSGAYQGKIDSIQKAKARSMGQGISAAGIDQSTNAYAGLQNVVKAGQGLNTDVLQGNVSRMNDQMSLAQTQASKDFADRSSTQQIAGTIAGAGAGIYANQASKETV